MKIAIVERNSDMLDIYRELFLDLPVRTDSFQVLDPSKIVGGAYDLLVSHLGLPYKSNLDRIQRIRHAAPHLPIVMISGCIEYSVDEMMKRGVSRVFYKPKDLLDAMAWIHQMVMRDQVVNHPTMVATSF
ncbi:response regulator [Pseudobacteriovorax antillogorgiicola]|uniref:Response regulatory domain-containing protein n=1 Tax=Pseudobacteriovorax antillogorgiicola TaxID=1513793 RepID=A0A1Y6BI54_9BACT|nr:response regulator [Pseudobacteriovorax antillogorgiicola]TCS56446.1 hypothetical protein EDD56_104268 [Pseudobacteriovorax antillogorgiicola]SMF05362.1 hypothetical protein SAMN06296036_10465 [Pseudobacteriovorax antillogorgiicola]